ncbi:MAG: T9SS type A sorting domain-containing protein [Ginsengibacter sp.]
MKLFSIKRFSSTSILVIVLVCVSAMLLAQPAAGTYNWDDYSNAIKATSSNMTPARWMIGNGLTAVTEGNGAGGAIRVTIDTSLRTSALRFDKIGVSPVISDAALKSTDGKPFNMKQFSCWPTSGGTSGTITINAKRNGVVLDSVTARYSASTPLVKIPVDVSSNKNFANIDEVVFTGFGPGIMLDDIVIDTAVSILPADLLSFNAGQVSSGVLLQWSIAAQQDDNNFTVEHSNDGSSFTAVVSLPEKNIAEGRANYSYADLNPSDGANYYRLLQYDVDGKVEDLGTKKVMIKDLHSAYIYPNPVTSNRVTVYLGHSITRPVLYQVADMNGSIVQKGILTNSVQAIGVDGLSKGFYILRLNTGEAIKLDKR